MRQTHVEIKKDLDTKHVFLTLSLASKAKNKSGIPKSHVDVQMFGKTEKEFEFEFQAAAGALAEHQNNAGTDNHDPEEIIKDAMDSLEEALLDLEQNLSEGKLVDSGVINP